MSVPYVLFDRDGTLIKHIHYLVDPNQVELMPEIVPALTLLKQEGFSFGIISNQSAIGRGIGTQNQVESVNARLLELLAVHGFNFSFAMFCPHTPKDQCECRKPGIALGITAIEQHDLEPRISFMIGDKISDVIFGHALGCQSIQVGDEIEFSSEADFATSDLLSAAKWICTRLKGD